MSVNSDTIRWLVVQNSFLSNTAIFVSFTVLVFDYILTFFSEIEYIWRKKMTPFSVLFLLNRYFALAAMLRLVLATNLAAFEPGSDSDYWCLQAGVQNGGPETYPDWGLNPIEPRFVLILLSTVTVLVAEAILILRVYAVYNNSKPIFGLLLLVWLAHLSLMTCDLATINGLGVDMQDVWAITNCSESGKLVIRIIGATLIFSKASGILYILPAIVFDTIVGAFLTFGLYRKSGKYRADMSLVGLIIQDGLLYFTVVFVSNICWLLVHVSAANNKASSLLASCSCK